MLFLGLARGYFFKRWSRLSLKWQPVWFLHQVLHFLSAISVAATQGCGGGTFNYRLKEWKAAPLLLRLGRLFFPPSFDLFSFLYTFIAGLW